jgi:hypothetical protein
VTWTGEECAWRACCCCERAAGTGTTGQERRDSRRQAAVGRRQAGAGGVVERREGSDTARVNALAGEGRGWGGSEKGAQRVGFLSGMAGGGLGLRTQRWRWQAQGRPGQAREGAPRTGPALARVRRPTAALQDDASRQPPHAVNACS